MSALSRKDYLLVARAVRDSEAPYDAKVRVTNSLVAAFTGDSDGFLRHVEVFRAIALSPEGGE